MKYEGAHGMIIDFTKTGLDIDGKTIFAASICNLCGAWVDEKYLAAHANLHDPAEVARIVNAYNVLHGRRSLT